MRIADREVAIKELSIAEVRAIFADAAAHPDAKPDVVGETIFDGISLREIKACTDLTDEQMNVMKISALAEVAKAVKLANPDFLEYRQRMINTYLQQQAIAQKH